MKIHNHKVTTLTTCLMLMGVAMLQVSCSKDRTKARELTVNEKYAIEKGYEAAEEIIKLPRGTMEEENAVLAVRAQEERLKEAGDSDAAAAYVSAVQEKLDSAGLLNPRTRRR